MHTGTKIPNFKYTLMRSEQVETEKPLGVVMGSSMQMLVQFATAVKKMNSILGLGNGLLNIVMPCIHLWCRLTCTTMYSSGHSISKDTAKLQRSGQECQKAKKGVWGKKQQSHSTLKTV